MRSGLAIMLAALSLGAIAADPAVDIATQHDVIAWHLSQGESRAQACVAAAQYFDMRCVVVGSDFVLSRGYGTEITYLATINIPSVE